MSEGERPLVRRLILNPEWTWNELEEAARDEIERLASEVERLRAVLQSMVERGSHHPNGNLRYGGEFIRDAQAALHPTEEQE